MTRLVLVIALALVVTMVVVSWRLHPTAPPRVLATTRALYDANGPIPVCTVERLSSTAAEAMRSGVPPSEEDWKEVIRYQHCDDAKTGLIRFRDEHGVVGPSISLRVRVITYKKLGDEPTVSPWVYGAIVGDNMPNQNQPPRDPGSSSGVHPL